MKLNMDFNQLEVGEAVDFEEACGIPISALGPGNVPAKALVALIWITQRRNNPEFTIEDARRVKFSELEFADPPAGAGSAGSTAGSRPSRNSTDTPQRKSGR